MSDSLLLATLFATIGSFGLGTALSWSAPTLPQMSGDHVVPGLGGDHVSDQGGDHVVSGLGGDHLANVTTLVLSPDQQSWVASLLNFGAFTAGPISGETKNH